MPLNIVISDTQAETTARVFFTNEGARKAIAKARAELIQSAPNQSAEWLDRDEEFAVSDAENWHWTIEQDGPDLVAEIGNLLEQVEQMRGLFSDEDGAIQAAIDSAEKALAALGKEA
jgi:hypothetical protein